MSYELGQTYGLYIGGRWVDAAETMDVLDPFDGSKVATVAKAGEKEALDAIAAADGARHEWRRTPALKRADVLDRVWRALDAEQAIFAEIIAREGSKTIGEASGEAMRACETLRQSAEEARRIGGEFLPLDAAPNGLGKIAFTVREPIGVVVAITPYNDPLNLVAHKLGPAIAAGNTVVLKPSSDTPISALELTRLFHEAGLPAGVLNTIAGSGAKIGPTLVTDKRVRKITLTGGSEAGHAIVRQAGIRNISMELGGNAPVLVLADADLDAAVESIRSGAFWASGQNCIGVQRVLIAADVYAEFEKRFVAATKAMKYGPKLDESSQMGPMVNEGEAKRIEEWIEEAKAAGARLLAGGSRNGNIVDPTVFADVPHSARIWKEEVFGPVVSLEKFTDLDAAIDAANDVPVGLHAGIFTADYPTAYRIARELECGGVLINDSSDWRADMMPFGGFKESGIGREGIRYAIDSMTELKVIITST